MARSRDAILNSTYKRYVRLSSLIDYHRRLYHEKDNPEITDEAYDSLVRELVALENKHPSLRSTDSVVMRVGGTPLEAFEKV